MADGFPDAGDSAGPGEARRQVWKISELTRRIKGTLEGAFGSVWVEGEISNFRKPASGHAYFTLKDATSQLRAVMFRGALAGVALPLKDGMLVRGFGQITVYEASGDYQILLKKIEPAGEGELMLRLEALKKKLAAEGLFDAGRKRPLPALPQHVGLVTSPTGAAIRDILQVLDRRFANLHVVLAPVRVQGAGAADEIAAAIDWLNQRGGLDVLIVGRGGGSLEDLWSFNEEVVVRAIVRSAIPVISAVGHEIDWTLSDFAADARAPTPSAAAEMVVKGKDELERRVADARRRLGLGARAAVLGWRNRLDRAARTPGLRDPLQRVRQAQQHVDFLAVRLQNALAGLPQLVRQRTESALRRMELAARMRLDENRNALKNAEAQLRMLNPKGVLARGYSLTRLRGGKILRSAADAPPGTKLETEFADGAVRSTVDAAGGGRDGGENGKGPELREGAGAAGGDRGGNGKRRTRPGKDGGRVRGRPETGQTLLF
ncbi:MAG TPA: exodeoxyribonuclease VII large subunit [Verrucomicrobia bacterium]|nr:exodeoxyribonuclease VII large subunit [Verrucomicrobiota bacterium]